MIRSITTILTILMAGLAFGQTGSTVSTFVAADVHASAKDVLSFDLMSPGNRVTIRGATMSHLIALAYGVDEEKIVNGPKWLDVDQFDVIAKAASMASLPELQAMLQTLLAERFQLKAKKEDKAFPVYALSVAKKGLLMKPSKSATEGDCVHPEDNSANRICTGVTIARLAEILPQLARAYFDHPVVDRTGAKGRFDFTLKWTARGLLGANADSVSLYDFLEKQLGIKVEPESVPMTAIAVESINRTPAPNPPDTAEGLPPMPTEFEVADIKVNKGSDPRHDFRFGNGRLDVAGIPMKALLQFAYGKDGDIDDDMLVGAPSWMDTDFFDIVAKTDPAADFEAMRPMLQRLLQERFHLQVHHEERPVTVYALTVGKGPRLKDGDPAARGSCRLTVDKGLRTYTCENTTMAEFAFKIRGVAAGYLDHSVADLTGLTGAYNFALSWSGINRTRPRADAQAKNVDAGAVAATPAAGVAGAASDPGDGITFFTGIEKIGLKMTQQKHPMPVLVIDKIDRTPSEN